MSDKPARTAARMSVSAHPAFPAIVILWFAALLGLGSLVLPAILLERLSEASGLSSMLPAAQPPLGSTARTAIALAAALVGGLAGLLIARRASTPRARQSAPGADTARDDQDELSASGGWRPISAHEELGECGIDSDREDPQFIEDPAGPSEPVISDQDGHASDFAEEWASDYTAAPEHEGGADLVAEEPAQYTHAIDSEVFESVDELDRPFEAPAAFPSDESPETLGTGIWNPEPAAQTSATPPTSEATMVELVDRFARALEDHRERNRAAPQTPAMSDAFAGPDEPAAPIPLPVSLRSVDFDYEAIGEEDEEDESAAGREESYSSLLAMRRPSSAPSDPESALRDALAKLERMSGTA